MVFRLLLSLYLFAIVPSAFADELTVLKAQTDQPPPPKMMTAYLQDLAHRALDRRSAEYEKLKTVEQITAYQQRMREFFITQIGGFPERTPLNANIIGRQDCAGYRLEKIIYESQPGFLVTAVLYLPLGKPPYPGVLVPCGHASTGKAAPEYQRVCILLARNGLAALCYDPISQGERYQILDPRGQPLLNPKKIGMVCCYEHTMIGVGCILLGINTARYRIWDGMRSLDYLLSRADIDPQRIGCTGSSGGGLLTSYVTALDQRVSCAAPSCFLATLRWLIDHAGPDDAEYNIHDQLAYGMEHADLLMMRAPVPTLICGVTADVWAIEATWDAFREIKRLYTRMGYAERIDLIEADTKHSFSIEQRVAAVRWMRRWLLGIDDAITEPDFPIMTEAQLQCTPPGQVLQMPGARSLYDLNTELEKQFADQRHKFWSTTPKAQALQKVRQITGIRNLADLPQPAVEKADSIQRSGYVVEKLVLRPEAGIFLPALCFRPSKATDDACLYLNGQGKQMDAGPGGPIEKLVGKGHLVLAVDLRGIGETEGTSNWGEGWVPLFGPDWQDFFRAYLLVCEHAHRGRFDLCPFPGQPVRRPGTISRTSDRHRRSRPAGTARRRPGTRALCFCPPGTLPGVLVECSVHADYEEPIDQRGPQSTENLRLAGPAGHAVGRENDCCSAP